ncbi:MAG: hypothetical protein MJZ03_01440 [archaeon]|nr:hypothetical protein [archaeon]
MDIDEIFKNIRESIKDNNISSVYPKIDLIVQSNQKDVNVILKCASLLKTIDDEKGCQSLVDLALSAIPKDGSMDYNTALAVRGLGRFNEAYSLIKRFKSDPEKVTEVARTMLLANIPGALELISVKQPKTIDDRLLLCDILCAIGEFKRALEEAKSIIVDDNTSYRSLVNVCSILMREGNEKESVKFAKSHLKNDKKNVDSLALNAYVMWVNGKILAAANYANKALHIDHSHIGALEIMAMCLIKKGKVIQAKILAGAINDKEPGNPAVIRILDACRILSDI